VHEVHGVATEFSKELERSTAQQRVPCPAAPCPGCPLPWQRRRLHALVAQLLPCVVTPGFSQLFWGTACKSGAWCVGLATVLRAVWYGLLS